MSLISIIVPIYKVEQYLPRCIESILSQTYVDYELILVDDGSPDTCGSICDNYGKKDKRIRVIHKTNGGLSDARNAGLKLARGEYIVFIDSDDWVNKFYLEELIYGIESTGADVCECQIQRVAEISDAQGVIDRTIQVFQPQDALASLIQEKELHQYVWNKIYRRKCIGQITFPVGKTNEDEFWTYQVIGNAHHICKINSVLYYYYQRPDSIIGQKFNVKRLDALDAKADRLKYIKQNYAPITDLAEIDLYITCIYLAQMTLKYMSKNDVKFAKDKIDHIRQHVNLKKISGQLSSTRKMWVLMSEVSFWGTCRIKNLLGKGF